MIAADASAARSVVVQKPSGHDRSIQLTRHALLAYTGDPGDATQFTELVARNIALDEIRDGRGKSVQACASFTRKMLADALRSRNSYNVNMLIAGNQKVCLAG